MDAPTILYALRWLIYDTFRQTIMSRVMVIMLGLSTLCILFCLGVGVEGGAVRDEGELWDKKSGQVLTATGDKSGKGYTGQSGKMSLMFGIMTTTFSREAATEVHFLLNIFASWIAGIAGVLMALVWTAGFVPEALQPSAASVLLAKPAPRWLFLLGKYLGVLCFVALHAAYFFLGTWFAIGVKTDVWLPAYLFGIPLLVLHFGVVYAFSVMLAVLFRSTMACVVGSVVFWIICFGMNYGRDFVVVYKDLSPEGPELSTATKMLSEVGYWALPKPADYAIMAEESLGLEKTNVTLGSMEPFYQVLNPKKRKDGKEAEPEFHPIAIALTSFLFAAFALWGAASQLAKTDY